MSLLTEYHYCSMELFTEKKHWLGLPYVGLCVVISTFNIADISRVVSKKAHEHVCNGFCDLIDTMSKPKAFHRLSLTKSPCPAL